MIPRSATAPTRCGLHLCGTQHHTGEQCVQWVDGRDILPKVLGEDVWLSTANWSPATRPGSRIAVTHASCSRALARRNTTAEGTPRKGRGGENNRGALISSAPRFPRVNRGPPPRYVAMGPHEHRRAKTKGACSSELGSIPEGRGRGAYER